MTITADSAGRITIDEYVLREITPQYIDTVKKALEICNKEGLLSSFIINTSIAVDEAENLILEHEKVPFVTYPYEWPPSMLKEAGLTLLHIIERLYPYGYIVNDVSHYNLTFFQGKIVWLDFTALQPRNYDKHLLKELIRYYIHPLYLHSKSQSSKVRSIQIFNDRILLKDFAGYLNPFEILQYKKNYYLFKILLRAGNYKAVFNLLKQWILSIDLETCKSTWGDYYKPSDIINLADSSKWRRKQKVIDRHRAHSNFVG